MAIVARAEDIGLQCSNCQAHVKTCDYCITEFDAGDEFLCYADYEEKGHKCSQCPGNWRKTEGK
ncbi:MAG TPA: hypothetical protein ENH82_19710 [bacterium]|nr:hypothetical protein [bacterium]